MVVVVGTSFPLALTLNWPSVMCVSNPATCVGLTTSSFTVAFQRSCASCAIAPPDPPNRICAAASPVTPPACAST